MRALSKDPKSRFASMAEMKAAIQDISGIGTSSAGEIFAGEIRYLEVALAHVFERGGVHDYELHTRASSRLRSPKGNPR